MDIFNELDILINQVKPINESEEIDDMDDVDGEDEVDAGFSTEDEGRDAAIKQIMDKIKSKEKKKEKKEGGGSGKKEKSEITKDDDPLSTPEDEKGGSSDKDKTFRSSRIDDLDDSGFDMDDDETSSDDDELDDVFGDDDDDDFEFDDFDYDDRRSGSGGGDEDESTESGDGYEDFEDGELGDEGDYDFGDEGDDYEDGDDYDFDDEEGDDGSGDEMSRSGKTGGSRGKKTSSDSSDPLDDIDYDDTLDYDSKDYDSLESEIEDALERAKDGSSSKHEKELLDKMKEDFGDGDEPKGDGESSSEKVDKLGKDIEDALDDSRTGSGELAGETLDDTPSSDSLESDMKKAGFSDKDIEDMKKAKDTDLSSHIDEDKIAKEAMAEMDKRAKERGEERTSSLSRTIMRNVLKGKISNMEWKEMVGVFLKSKSKSTGGSLSKSKTTGWGDKKHLWRDAIMPKTTMSGGDLDEINCFIDFSGSVSQPLVFSFLQRVLQMCTKLSFGKVNVYGFAYELSEPFVIKKKDLVKGDDDKTEEFLKKMWSFIASQELDGRIENFEEVAKEILKLKRKNHDTPILIFGDGLWGVSYPNPKPPMCLKEICPRYLKDILALVYYKKDTYYEDIVKAEVGYLKDMVGLKHVVTTEIDELK